MVPREMVGQFFPKTGENLLGTQKLATCSSFGQWHGKLDQIAVEVAAIDRLDGAVGSVALNGTFDNRDVASLRMRHNLI